MNAAANATQAPIRSTPLRSWALTALAALCYWAVALAMATSYILMERENRAYSPEELPFSALVVVIGASHCLLMRLALEPISRRPFWQQAVLAALLVLAVALPFEHVMRAIMRVLMPGDNGTGPLPLNAQIVVPSTVFWSGPFGVWALGVLAVLHDANAREQERWLAQARAQAHEAQVRALRYQVNPHFLYNTLNSIAALILDRRNDLAEAMVIRLSDFFRSSLAQDPMVDATLAAELAVQRLYLDIEQVRFADQLELVVDVPRELQAALVPSLLLQPLVENALKHGMHGPGRRMRLTLSARASEQQLIVTVADDGRGSRAVGTGGSGVGLRNVEQRLATRFSRRAHMETEVSECGFIVRLNMPLRYQ